MVKKIQKSASRTKASPANSPLSGAIRDSAQQIWLAGLGAFSKAQEEGGKVFETLVKEGVSIQRKTQAVAEDRINEATGRVSNMASEISSKAQGQWDKLETLFEERVAKALGRLGVPAARDVEALVARIDELGRMVQEMSGLAPAKPTRKTAPRKAAAKTAAKAAAKTASPTARAPATRRSTTARKTAAGKKAS
ncbi:MAG: phasin family protein [Burkholderiaceae bacterium]